MGRRGRGRGCIEYSQVERTHYMNVCRNACLCKCVCSSTTDISVSASCASHKWVCPELYRPSIPSPVPCMVVQVEVCGSQGLVDEAQSLMKHAEQLKRDKERMLEKKVPS